MVKKIICAIMGCLFLTSSILLPLGDFSLIRDLPQMYRNYTRITSPEEAGWADFIGDYLLHGKEIFGHNEHDKVPAKGNEVQFQHQASPLNVVFSKVPSVNIIAGELSAIHPLFHKQIKTSGYLNELFRPPLA
jgi:hypothetical protein